MPWQGQDSLQATAFGMLQAQRAIVALRDGQPQSDRALFCVSAIERSEHI